MGRASTRSSTGSRRSRRGPAEWRTIVERRGAYYLDFRDALGGRVQNRYRTPADAEGAFELLVPLSGQRRGRGDGSIDPRITVGEWVQRWLRQIAPSTLEPRAWEAHERACTRFVVPGLGHIRLTKLRRTEVRAFLLDVQTQRVRRLPSSGVRRTRRVLHSEHQMVVPGDEVPCPRNRSLLLT